MWGESDHYLDEIKHVQGDLAAVNNHYLKWSLQAKIMKLDVVFFLKILFFWLSLVLNELLNMLEIRWPLYLNTLRSWIPTILLLEMGRVGKINFLNVYIWVVQKFWVWV